MQIETKFDINDEVWWLEDEQVRKDIVTRIESISFKKKLFGVDCIITEMHYFTECSNLDSIEESFLFSTKQELLNSL